MESNRLQQDFWIRSLEASFDQGWFSSLQAIAYDRAQHRVAVGGDNGKVSMLNLSNGRTQVLGSVNDKIRAVCFASSDVVFVSTEYGSVARLSAQRCSLELIQKISDKAITSLAFHSVHGLLAGSDDYKLRIIDPHTLSVRAESPKEGSYVQAVAFSADGTRAVSAGCDNCLRVYKLPSLQEGEILHQGEDSQREAVAAHGVYVAGSKDGLVTVIEKGDSQNLTCLPVSDQEIVSVLIPQSRPSLLTVDGKGRLQEWSLANLNPISALDSELTTKAAALADTGDVAVLCSESKVVAYLRASAVEQYKALVEFKEHQDSLSGLIQRLIRWLFRMPRPEPPSDPGLPLAAAVIASRMDADDLAHERSLSEMLVSCYEAISKAAKKVNWKQVSRTIQQHQRNELEKQKLELRRIREERLAQAADEARRKREFRERVHHERKEQARRLERLQAQRRAEAEQSSGSFWRGVGKAFTESGSSSGGSDNRTRQVRSYVRKDGTRVRSYKRR